MSRIAKLVQGSGVSAFKVLAVVAVAIGLGALLCKAARILDAFTGVIRIVREIAIVLATGLAIRVIIEFLKRSPIIRIPVLNRVLIIVILVLVLVEKLLQRFASLAATLDALEPILNGINGICDFVIEAGRDALEKGEEVSQDLLDLL